LSVNEKEKSEGEVDGHKNEIALLSTEAKSSAISDSDWIALRRFRGTATGACTRNLLPHLYTGLERLAVSFSPVSTRFKPEGMNRCAS